MQYAVLIYEALGRKPESGSDDAAAVSAEYATLGADDRVFGGAQLRPTDMATTVRVDGGRALVTDGPFADTKEVFGGYYLIDVEDLDSALDFAARIPAARLGGAVEVRPIAMVTP